MGGHGGIEGEYSASKVFANVFISFVGAGVLGLPYAFSQAGYAIGTIVMIFVVIISVKAMLLLVDCKNNLVERIRRNDSVVQGLSIDPEDPDFGDLALVVYGKRGWWTVQVSIIASQIGFCCAYLIFISENLNTLYPQLSVGEWLLASLVPQAFLVTVRDLKGLSLFSLLADVANVFAYLVVFYFDFEAIDEEGSRAQAVKWNGLPFFMGVAIYCYEGAGMILSLENSVPPAHRHEFPRVFSLALGAITVLYVLFGVAGYSSFGEDTAKIITLNMPPGIFPGIVKGCLCFSLLFTLPVMLFPVSFILDRQLALRRSNGNDAVLPRFQGNVLRVLLAALAGAFAAIIPDFSVIMGLIGSTCCMLLALILPGLLHLFFFREELSWRDRARNNFIVGLGVVASVMGFLDVVKRLNGSEGSGIH